jgi:hypothetical protein
MKDEKWSTWKLVLFILFLPIALFIWAIGSVMTEEFMNAKRPKGRRKYTKRYRR